MPTRYTPQVSHSEKSAISLAYFTGCREDQIQQMNVHPKIEGCIHDSHGDADGGAVTRGGRLDSIESQRFQPKLCFFVAASFPL